MKKLLIILVIFSAMFSFVITHEKSVIEKQLYKGGHNGKQIEWQIQE